MPVVSAIAGIGSSVAGGILGANAASNAASAETTQANAALNANNQVTNNALALQKQAYQTDQQNEAPYQAAGTNALNQLAGATLSGAPNAQTVLAQDPGYQFRLDEQNQAVQRMEAAGGGVGSGGALKAAAQYSGDLASNEYQNAFGRVMQANQQRFNQLYGVAGMGQNANQQELYAGANMANQSGADLMDAAKLNDTEYANIGDAMASGYMGRANAYSDMFGGVSKALPGLAGLLPNSAGNAAVQTALNTPSMPLPAITPYSNSNALGMLGYPDYSGSTGTIAAV